MNRLLTLIVIGSGAVSAAGAGSVTRTTSITGSMSPTQETCFQGLTNAVGDGENCMYDGGPAAGGNDPIGTDVIGPNYHISYYDSDATPAAFQTTIDGLARRLYVTTVGDGKISQKITGSITIDDGGNGFGAGDLLSFTLTLTSPGTGDIIRHYSTSVVDKYHSMTQTLAPFAASSATPNGSGGFDYVIGFEGFPSVRTFALAGACFGRPFGEAECIHSFSVGPDPNFWNGTSLAGLGQLEGNLGAKTVGTLTGLTCIDSRGTTGVESNDCVDSGVSYSPWVNGPCATPGDCTGKEGQAGAVRGAAEDVGWDDMLLKVSTDATGRVIAVEGFNVDDYKIFGQVRCGDNTAGTGSYVAICNSWTSGHFTAISTATAACVDFAVQVIQNNINNAIPTASRCTGFSSPLTLSVTTPPTHGTANVDGANIVYTPSLGYFGPDTLTYQGSDGINTDPGVLTITVTTTLDTDGDGVVDGNDNCTLVPNAQTGNVPGTSIPLYQLDSDHDGYGNLCDADLNNSGLVTTADFAMLRSVLNELASYNALSAAADMNGSGTVTATDFAMLRARLNTRPGPSGLHPN